MDNTQKGQGGFLLDRVSISVEFYRLNKFVMIAADMMFVSGMPFFGTYSRKIKFLTVEYLPQRTAKQLANALRKVVFLYARGGFVVRHAMMDMEFEKVKDLVPLVEVEFEKLKILSSWWRSIPRQRGNMWAMWNERYGI